MGVCTAGQFLHGELRSWHGAGLTWKPPSSRAGSSHPLLLCKNQQQQKKPCLALALSHLALIRGRMFLCGHRRVTEALGNRNPLPLSHSKDCPVGGLGTLPRGCKWPSQPSLPPTWVCGQPGRRHAHFGMAPGRMLAPSSLLARERDTAACSCLLCARAALCAQEPLPCAVSPPFPPSNPEACQAGDAGAEHCMPVSLAGGLCAPACPTVTCGQHRGRGNTADGSFLSRWGCRYGRVLGGFLPGNLGAKGASIFC